MAEPRKDSVGILVEVGDIVASFPRAKYSNGFKVGMVTAVHPSGRVTMKYAQKVNIYAYQTGVPDVEKVGQRRQLKAGVPDRGRYGLYRFEDYETVPYTYTQKDYTIVGHKWVWVKGQAADIHLLVLRKHDGTKVADLMDMANLNYNTESPNLD